MSDKIDQRIVEMSFENSKFEKGILESKNSLKDFNNALKNTAKDDFSGLDRSVKDMSRSFSVFQEIAVGALRRIGEQAINTGANIFKSLALDPVTQGFEEMELKMNSTQTIMASTGETLSVVNGYLEELNEYSDKTIYSFSDMTQNIGKFTNAGVKLDMAVASIKGISNAAALAGANSQEASRAMYNFAQALSAGHVKLIDWKSIENANMATVEFKQQLLDSAVAAGTLTKSADGMYKVLSTDAAGKTMKQAISATRNFNDSLSFQWMTTEALTNTLAAYSDETTEIGRRAAEAATQVTTFSKLMDTLKESVGSGWARTFELIFGDFNEARDLWTGMNNALGSMIDTMSDARNNLLSGGLGSGWKQFMNEGISNVEAFENTLAVVAGEAGVKIDELVKSAGSMEKAVKGNWVTGNMLVDTITRMSASVENLSDEELRNAGYTEKTRAELLALRDAFKTGTLSADEFAAKMGALSGRENIIQGLKNSVVALLTVLKPVSQAFDQIFPPMTVSRLYEMTKTFRDFTGQLVISEETADKIKRTFAGLFAVIDIGWQGVRFLGTSVLEVVKAFLPLGDGVLGATASLGDFLVTINEVVKSSGVFQYGLLGVKIAVALLREIITSTIGKVTEFVHSLWTAEDPLMFLRDAGQRAFGGILDSVKMVITWVSGKFSRAIQGAKKVVDSDFGASVSGVFGSILDVLKNIVDFIAGDATAGFETFGEALRNLDFGKIATFVTGGVILILIRQISDLTGALTGLANSAAGILNNISKKFLTTKSGNKIRDLAFAIGVLSASIWVLSTIPADSLTRGLTGLAGAVSLFVAAYAGIQTVNVIASKVMKDQEMISSAFNLVGIAAALAIMAGAIKTISKIDKTTVWDSVTILGLMLGFIAGYQALSALISKIPGQQKVTMNLMGMSGGILGLVGALALLNLLSVSDLQNSLGKMSVIMLVVSGMQALFSLAAKVGGGNKLSTSILGLAAGLAAMVGVMKLLSVIDSRTITSGIGNLALMTLLLGGIEIVMGVAGRIGGGKKFRANILSTQVGMLAMVALVAVISMIEQEDINKGLTTLASMAGIIGAIELLTSVSARIGGNNKVQKVLGSVTITMLAFTGVIALLGNLEQSTIDRGMITLVKMTGLITAIEMLTALASRITGDAKVFSPLLGVVAAILTLTGALALLAMLDQASLRAAAESLAVASVAILALSVASRVMVKAIEPIAKDSKGLVAKVKAAVAGLGAMTAMLTASVLFFGAVKLVEVVAGDISWESIAKFTTGLGIISAMMVGFALLPIGDGDFAGKMSGLLQGFKAMMVVMASTLAFFGALKLIQPVIDGVSWESLAKFTAGLTIVSALLLGIAALSVPLAAAGKLGVGVIKGAAIAAGALSVVVLAFVGLAEVLSLLDVTRLASGIDSLVLVGEGIGRFVGALAGGIASEALIGIGRGMAGFVESLAGFNPEATQSIKNLAEAFLIITAGGIVEGISRFVTGRSSIDLFAKQLRDMIDALKEIDPAQATNASNTIAALAPMAGHLKTLANAAKDIPNSGGFIGDFMGDNDIDKFGQMLARFVAVLSGGGSFGSTVTAEKAEIAAATLAAMAPMADNLKKLAKAATAIPNSGGFIGEFMGNNDIDKFGIMLTDFVNTFYAIPATTASDASGSLKAMAPMADNLKKFAKAASDIPNSGGFLSVFFGTVDLPTFSTQIEGLIGTFGAIDGTKLSNASANLSSMSTNMLPALVKFSEFSNGLENSGGLSQLFSGNTTLNEFGIELASFVSTLSRINFTVVDPAMQAMTKITASFENIGADVLDNAKKSFENNKAPLQASISTILDAPIKNVNSKKGELTASVDSVFGSVTSKSQTYVKDFNKLGGDVIDGLKMGINAKKPSAIDSVKSVMNSLVTSARKVVEVRSPSRVFAEIGGWCTKGLAVGITGETNVAVKAGENMALATEEGIRNSLGVHSLSKKFSEIGNWLPKSIGDGVQNGKNQLLGIANSLGIDTGNLSVDGIISSISGGESAVTSGISALLDSLTGSKDVKSAAEGTGTGIANSMTKGLQSGISDGIGGSKTKAAIKSELDKLRDRLEEENFYGRITLQGELVEYEKLRAAYREGSEERKKLDREVYSRLKTIHEAQLSHIQEVTDAQNEATKDRLDLEEKYNKDVEKAKADSEKKLSDLNKKYSEDVASSKSAADKKKQSEEKKYYQDLNSILEKAESERQRTREQYASAQKSINERLLSDITAQNKAYEDAVKSRADAIYNSYGLFSAVGEEEEVSGEDLLKNLQDQGAALSEWKQSLDALAERGVGAELIEELQKMGPASKAQIKALLTLTDEQMTEYVSLFEGKYAFARTKAEEELEGLKDSTSQAIKDLNSQAAIDLSELEVAFKDAMSVIDSNMAADMEDVRITHKAALDEIEQDLKDKLTKLESDWNLSSNEIKADLTEKLNEMSAEYAKSMNEINTNVAKKLEELKNKFSSTMKEVAGLTEAELRKLIADNKVKLGQLNYDTTGKLADVEKAFDTSGGKIVSGFDTVMKLLNSKTSHNIGNLTGTVRNALGPVVNSFTTTGGNAADGFAQGIRAGAYLGVNAAEYLARLAVRAANKVLDEHSPSKVFHGIGQYVSVGFANGITDYAHQAERASQDMANGPIAAVSRALADLDNAMGDDMDWSPTITPVLDLSNIRSNDLAGILGSRVQLAAASSRMAADTVQNGSREPVSQISIINKFDLAGAVIRSDYDIDLLATKLQQKQEVALRGRGMRSLPRR